MVVKLDIKIEKTIHRSQKRIKILFKKNSMLVQKIKTIPNCRWSATMQCWHVPDTVENYNYITTKGFDNINSPLDAMEL